MRDMSWVSSFTCSDLSHLLTVTQVESFTHQDSSRVIDSSHYNSDPCLHFPWFREPRPCLPLCLLPLLASSKVNQGLISISLHGIAAIPVLAKMHSHLANLPKRELMSTLTFFLVIASQREISALHQVVFFNVRYIRLHFVAPIVMSNCPICPICQYAWYRLKFPHKPGGIELTRKSKERHPPKKETCMEEPAFNLMRIHRQ